MHRLAQDVDKPFCDRGGIIDIPNVFQQHSEFISADTRGGVAGAQTSAQSLRDSYQYLIALNVPEAIVDGLEIVDVQKQDRWLMERPRIASNGVLQAIVEERAIGQAVSVS